MVDLLLHKMNYVWVSAYSHIMTLYRWFTTTHSELCLGLSI